MNAEDFKKRTKAYAVRVVRLVDCLPHSRTCDNMGQQLLRSGTSVGANYRAVCRAKSQADFINKLRTVEEECDESLYWMEILIETGKIKEKLVKDLMQEGSEILAITIASAKTARTSKDSSIVNRKS